MVNFLFAPCMLIINIIIASRFNKALTGPYMDEEFHFDQTIHYLSADFFYWNSKLTTFPGLFVLSYFLMFIFSSFLNIDGFSFLRLVNSLYGTGLSFLSSKFDYMNNRANSLMFQMIVTLLPINYFYNFLFYTDSLSTLLVFSFYYGVNRWKKRNSFIVIIFNLDWPFSCLSETK
jgi:alpha-1,2-glucosyltransferase